MSKILTTHLTVEAPVGAVWETLTDLAGYWRWNPFITAAAGSISVGERLALTIEPPGARPMTFKPWVTAVEQHHYIEWLGRLVFPGLVDGRHSFTLTPMAKGRTLVQQSETFTGVLVPHTGSMLVRTRAGFVAMNKGGRVHLRHLRLRTVRAPERRGSPRKKGPAKGFARQGGHVAGLR